MSATPAVSIYESTFAQSDKTDAILVVDPKEENNDDSDDEFLVPVHYEPQVIVYSQNQTSGPARCKKWVLIFQRIL